MRGFLYAIIAIGSVLGPEFVRFADTPPKNKYEIAAVVTGCIVAAATALRAYIDQHLSKEKEPQNETNTTQS